MEIDILQHNIEYWYTDSQEMPDYEIQHVQEQIIKGFSSGQLVDNDNVGWWKIA